MKFPTSLTLKRVAASALIGVAALGTSACGYIYQQPTTIIYSASDGQRANLLDEKQKEVIQLRNIMVIAQDADSAGRLLGTVLNQGEKDATVTLAFPQETLTLEVPAGKEIRLEEEANELLLEKAGAAPGLLLENVKVSADTVSETTSFNVPVLDGALEEYAPYLPNLASAAASASANTKH